MNHLPVLPILIPMLAGALILLLERRGIIVQRIVAWTSILALLVVAGLLVDRAGEGGLSVYLIGDWPARLGIALLVDRVAALMVMTTSLLAVASLLYACANWDRRALHFHALFQLQLAGLNGAFLTGDLFNLFVFFEVLLIASYGLMLSGGRSLRMRAGLHYVVFNIMASTLFLIALGLLYGLTGTLNMAEMAARVAADPADQAIIRSASAILLIVFCSKAALLPLYLWLPETYSRTPAAVVALFTVMTKLGVYAVLRVYTLVFAAGAGESASWVWPWLLGAGVITLVLASLGVLAGRTLRGTVAYLVIASAATLFIAISMHTGASIGAGLYYLAHSTFVTAALYLIVDLVRRQRGALADRLAASAPMPQRTLLGLLFLIGAVSVAGLPPLSGFIGKLALLGSVPADQVWWIWATILITSLMTVVALSRVGSQIFWRGQNDPVDPATTRPTAPRRLEVAAAIMLLGFGIVLTVAAAPILDYTAAAGAQILATDEYLDQVRATLPLLRAPSP